MGLDSSHESGLILHTSFPFPCHVLVHFLGQILVSSHVVGCPVNLITHQLCGAENASEGRGRVGRWACSGPATFRQVLSSWVVGALPSSCDSVTSVTSPSKGPTCALSL